MHAEVLNGTLSRLVPPPGETARRRPATPPRPRRQRAVPASAAPGDEKLTRRGCILLVALMTTILGGILSTLVVLVLNGDVVNGLLGPIPTIALTMGICAGLLVWLCIRLARTNFLGWVVVGSIGLMFSTVLALIAGQIAEYILWGWTLGLEGSIWYYIVEGALSLLPLAIPIGFMVGIVVFTGAGWAWMRYINAPVD